MALSRRAASALILLAVLAGSALRLREAAKPSGLEAFWRGDWEYYSVGARLADAGVYAPYPGWDRSASRLPLYSGWLACLRRVAPGPRAARLAQAALDGGAIAGVALAAWTAAGPAAGAAAAWLYALSPLPRAQAASLQLEALFVPCVLALALALLYWSWRGESVRRAALAGAAAGFCLFCRSTLWFLPAAAAALAARKKPRRRAAAVFAALAYAALLPWALRNARAFHELIPLEGGWTGSWVLWQGTLGMTKTLSISEMAGSGAQPDTMATLLSLPEEKQRGFLLGRAWSELRRDPRPWLAAMPGRLALLWSEQWVLGLLALGLLFWPAARRAAAVPLLVLAAFQAHVLVAVVPRYGRPMFPLVCALGAAALVRLLAGARAAPERPQEEIRRYLAAWTLLVGAVYAVTAFSLLVEPAPILAGSPAKPLNDQAMELAGRGDFPGAERLLDRALAADPCLAEARISRGVIRRSRGADAAAAEDEAALASVLEAGRCPGEAPAGRLEQF